MTLNEPYIRSNFKYNHSLLFKRTTQNRRQNEFGAQLKSVFLLITESNSYSLVYPLSFQFTLSPIDHSTLAEQYFGWEGFIKHGGGDGINAELVSVGLPLCISNAWPEII